MSNENSGIQTTMEKVASLTAGECDRMGYMSSDNPLYDMMAGNNWSLSQAIEEFNFALEMAKKVGHLNAAGWVRQCDPSLKDEDFLVFANAIKNGKPTTLSEQAVRYACWNLEEARI